ncbi:glycosyl hydrolase family 5 [Aquimarina sp. U1-2]|uniref:glycosyl hydrolase family 5 n=1 Tax=Aquimarina sp. U1-2 TaxID=2823141 RepID=UPI0035302124
MIISSFITFIIVVLFGISQTLTYLNTDADRSSMLHLALNKEKLYVPKVTWKDTMNPGRSIEKQVMIDIEEDYLNAWYVSNIAYQDNKLEGVDNYYTTSALQNIHTIIQDNSSRDISIHSTTINHNLTLDFYSADGQLAIITDSDVKEYQYVYQEDNLLFEIEEKSDYQALMLLEDGYWRIRHLIKKENNRQDIHKKSNGYTKVIRYRIYVDNKEYQIKGINYYPQKTPWDMFGNDYDINLIKEDFDMIKAAGLNTIRIFVPYHAFGKEQVAIEQLKKLRQVLDEAKAHNLMAIVTLFDFYGDYSVLNWTLTHRHAEQIVSSLKDHKGILAWDIKNEPNLDFDSRGKENVVGWLKEMILQIKQYDPNHLITIGWSDVESSAILKEEVDIVSFHYYQDIDDFDDDFLELDIKIDKPLILQEFGLSSNWSFWNVFGATEKNQAEYHQQFQKKISEKKIHYLSWTLYDFKNVPSSVVGKLPWRKHKQKHFGFIDKHGKKKKSFKHISN